MTTRPFAADDFTIISERYRELLKKPWDESAASGEELTPYERMAKICEWGPVSKRCSPEVLNQLPSHAQGAYKKVGKICPFYSDPDFCVIQGKCHYTKAAP